MQTSLRRVALLAIAVMVSIASLPARGEDAIDAYMRQQMEQLRLPGVALAVVCNGRPVTVRTYGKANLELDVPVTQQTVFELGADEAVPVLRDLLSEKADSASFTAPMRLFLTTATGKGLWDWIASHGELTSLTSAVS
ncbi:MAG TPA: serine hydrolase [Thermoanaerobaculia bacterium]|nr:serine hydrolase [Thermoanaerobaculia bacterium]